MENSEETINVGGNAKKESEKIQKLNQAMGDGADDIPPALLQTMLDNEFPEFTEIIDLPSKGIFYPNKQSQIKVKHLTAEDENILTTIDLIRNGKALDVLLDNAIVDSTLSSEDMVVGDRNYVLLQLRKEGYGDEYEVKMTCPKCNEEFRDSVLISTLKFKELSILPGEDGYYSVKLPKSKWDIKFRLLKGSDESYLTKKNEQTKKIKKSGVAYSQVLTDRYVLQIMDINGNKDKTYIARAISKMPISDSFFFREYAREVEPGVDMEHQFTCKKCGESFEETVPVTAKLFWPNARL